MPTRPMQNRDRQPRQQHKISAFRGEMQATLTPGFPGNLASVASSRPTQICLEETHRDLIAIHSLFLGPRIFQSVLFPVNLYRHDKHDDFEE